MEMNPVSPPVDSQRTILLTSVFLFSSPIILDFELHRVQGEPVAVPTGSHCEIDYLGRTLMVTPCGADLLDKDPATGAFIGLLKPDGFQPTAFDDQCNADGR